jgi:hypothetical protein
MEIDDPVKTFRHIVNLLFLQHYIIDDLQLIKLNDTQSKLVFHTRLEMDRMRSLRIRLGRINQVSRLECLYDQQRNKLYK